MADELRQRAPQDRAGVEAAVGRGGDVGEEARVDPALQLRVGRADDPATRMVVEVADASVVVVRGCYLTLRRAVHAPLTPRAAGIAFLDEPGRSLGPSEARDVLDRPVLTRVPVRAPIARAVDAGVLAVRTPEALARAATRLLDRLERTLGATPVPAKPDAA